MESQLQRPTHGHHLHEEDHHTGLHSVEGDVEHEHDQHEKKSVLKKVKDKAKKIKDTIKKHGHNHDQEHQYRHDQISEEEYDDDDEDDYTNVTADAPQIHVYESPVIPGTKLPMQTDFNLEKPTDPREDRFTHNNVRDGGGLTGLPEVLAPARPPVQHHVPEQSLYQSMRNVVDMEEDVVEPTVMMGPSSMGLAEDPPSLKNRHEQIPPSNYPTGQGFNLEKATNMREDRPSPNIGREAEYNARGGGVTRPSDLGRQTGVTARQPLEEMEPKVRIGPPMGLEEDPHSPKNLHGEIPPSNYQSKVVDPTGKGGKEADVAPLVRRLDNLHVHDESKPQPKPESKQSSYTGSHDQFAPQPTPTKDQFNPESPKMSDPNRPESMPRDTIADQITSATSVIADKAVSAKNVVASKLGYGEGGHQEVPDASRKPATELAAEYGHKVVETLTPVYEKVAGAGTAILEKVQGGGGGGDTVAAEGTDKGVSMKEYLSEKFKPGDDDRALSETIADAFHGRKEVMMKTGEEPPPPMQRVVEPTGGENPPPTGVVHRLKVTVGSFLGKSAPTPSVQHSSDQASGKEEAIGQRPKLRE